MTSEIPIIVTQANSEPTSVIGTVAKGNTPPRRKPNADLRDREYLTEGEIGRLLLAARRRNRRYGARDGLMILMGYRHGLRVPEMCSLTWEQVDWKTGQLHVRRRKNGISSVHLLGGEELRGLRLIQRSELGSARYIFMSERGSPITTAGFRKMLARLGKDAGFAFGVHPHQLRHGCGFKLANDGRDTRSIQVYLGHRNIAHTTRYAELSSERFRHFWED